MGCHSRSLIDINRFFDDFEGRPPARNSHWVATSGQFLRLPGKTARTGGVGEMDAWRVGEWIGRVILVTISFSLLKIQGLAYGTARRNRCSDSSSETTVEGQRPSGRLDADNWPTFSWILRC